MASTQTTHDDEPHRLSTLSASDEFERFGFSLHEIRAVLQL